MLNDLISIGEGMEDWSMLQSRNIIGSKKFEDEKKTDRVYSFGEMTDEEFIAKQLEHWLH